MSTNERFSIKRFDADEHLSFKAIRLEALQVEPGVYGSNYQREAAFTDKHWKERLENPLAAYWALYHKQELIGMTGVIVTKEDAEAAELIASYIRVPYRGKGLSRLLYEVRLDWAKQKGLKRLVISHRASNIASKAANQKFGFRYVFTEGRIWADGSKEDNVFYELKLE